MAPVVKQNLFIFKLKQFVRLYVSHTHTHTHKHTNNNKKEEKKKKKKKRRKNTPHHVNPGSLAVINEIPLFFLRSAYEEDRVQAVVNSVNTTRQSSKHMTYLSKDAYTLRTSSQTEDVSTKSFTNKSCTTT